MSNRYKKTSKQCLDSTKKKELSRYTQEEIEDMKLCKAVDQKGFRQRKIKG